MSKKISAKIRQAGEVLFETKGQEIITYFEELIQQREPARGYTISFADANVFMSTLTMIDFWCDCQDFSKIEVCPHWVLFELVNQVMSENFLYRHYAERLQASSFYHGKRLLDFSEAVEEAHLEEDEAVGDQTELYYLSAEGAVNDNYQLTFRLKLRHRDGNRAYVVKSINNLVEAAFYGGDYNLSKQHPNVLLKYDYFDAPSQALLDILFKFYIHDEDAQYDYDYQPRHRQLVFPSHALVEGCRALMALEHFSFENAGQTYTQLIVDQAWQVPSQPQFQLEELPTHFVMRSLNASFQVLQDSFILMENRIYPIKGKQQDWIRVLSRMLAAFSDDDEIDFGRTQQANLLHLCRQISQFVKIEMPDHLRMRDFEVVFDFSVVHGYIQMAMSWIFEDRVVTDSAMLAQLDFAYDVQKGQRLLEKVAQLGFGQQFQMLSRQSISSFYMESLPAFRRLGQVNLSDELAAQYIEEPVLMDIVEEGGYLSVNFDFSTISEQEVAAALQALWNQEPSYTAKTGQILIFDDEAKKVAASLKTLRAKYSGQQLQLPRSAAYTVSETLKTYDQIRFSKDFEQMAYDLAHPNQFNLPTYEVQADLRHYQKDGVRWLAMLNHYGFGGILADDMGLGKTLQTITLLQSTLTSDQRVLIVAPASLLYNWQEEFRKFAPQMRVQVVYGTKAERKQLLAADCQIFVTSYASFRQDAAQYAKQVFDYLILDEAQALKNSQTKIAQALRDLEVKTCFALSGTPIENRLEEIWSIFQVVLPGLLPSKREFSKLSPEMVAHLIQPFILRRKKEEVLKDLPDLTENIYTNELVEAQKSLYLAQLRQMQADVANSSEADLKRRKIEILAGLTRLRQICSSPKLFLADYAGDSGKLASLFELMTTLRENGRRPLIFSQFRGMLDQIESGLSEMGLESFKLTGDTPATQRQAMTHDFNQGRGDAFLISLKAGGTGLNLTGADTVILCDLWWNPAVESQAIGRSHRMGQTKKVEVYRLITLGTIEEKILALQESKKALVNSVLDGKETKESLSIEDIKEILGIALT